MSNQSCLVAFGVTTHPGEKKKVTYTVLVVKEQPREAIDYATTEYLKNMTRKILVVPFDDPSGFKRFAVVEESP